MRPNVKLRQVYDELALRDVAITLYLNAKRKKLHECADYSVDIISCLGTSKLSFPIPFFLRVKSIT